MAALAAALGAPSARAQTPGNHLLVEGTGSPVTVSVAVTHDRVTVADGGVLVVNAPLSVTGDLVVQAGGRLTLDARAFGDAGLPVLHLAVDGGLVVEAGGAVDLNGQGLATRTTVDPATGAPVPWPGSRYTTSGASHFALGGGAAPPARFDEPLAPRFPGAGGSSPGGGALVASAAWARLDGLVRADGLDTGDCSPGGAAGGTLRLTVERLEGRGTLSAAGGAYDRSLNCSTGGGAGGLIHLAFTESTFAGVFETGGGGSSSAALAGATGTALLADVATGEVRVAAGELLLRGTETLAALSVGLGATLRVEGPASVARPLLVEPGARVVLASPRALDRLALVPSIGGTVVVDADLDTALELTLGAEAVLRVNRRLLVKGLTAQAGALVTHDPEVDTMHLVASTALVVEVFARVNASGQGLPAEVTIDPIGGQRIPGSNRSNGGSHGGRGGRCTPDAVLAAPYDDPRAPRFLGGGGGTFSSTGTGGNGGGLVRLTAALLRVDGAVLANGVKSPSTSNAGSGAGGAIVIEADRLEGAGALRALGGPNAALSASQAGGAGGGGLVRIRAGEDALTGEVSVSGGTGFYPGEAGQIVRDTAASLPPRIVSEAPARAELGRAFDYAPVATGARPLAWSLAAGPDGAWVDPTTGIVVWAPSMPGATSFTLEVSNAFGSALQAFTVEVVHTTTSDGGVEPPRFLSTPNTSARCEVPYRYAGVHAPRVEGKGPFTFSVHPLLGTELPTGLAVDASSGAFAWTPRRVDVGTYPLELRVEGPTGSAWQRFAVIVECPPLDARFGSGCGCATPASEPAALALLAVLGAGLAALAARRRPGRSPRSRP